MSKLSLTDLMGLYHTTLRNGGLLTAIAFTCLNYSRLYWNHKNYEKGIFRVSFILFTLVVIICSLILFTNMLNDFSKLTKNITPEEKQHMEKWLIIPKIMLVVNSSMLLLHLYKVFTQFN